MIYCQSSKNHCRTTTINAGLLSSDSSLDGLGWKKGAMQIPRLFRHCKSAVLKIGNVFLLRGMASSTVYKQWGRTFCVYVGPCECMCMLVRIAEMEVMVIFNVLPWNNTDFNVRYNLMMWWFGKKLVFTMAKAGNIVYSRVFNRYINFFCMKMSNVSICLVWYNVALRPQTFNK